MPLLFQDFSYRGQAAPDDTATFELYDRVVCARGRFGVPVGLRGTVIGVGGQPGSSAGTGALCDDRPPPSCEILFDTEFDGGAIMRYAIKYTTVCVG